MVGVIFIGYNGCSSYVGIQVKLLDKNIH